MTIAELGVPTHHTRVESWEVDFNQHWNARFYARSFQHASERAFGHDGRENPGATGASIRISRFNRELFVAAAVEIRSMRLADGPLKGWTLHLLSSEGTASATAVERPPDPLLALPEVSAEEVKSVLPRSTKAPEISWDPAAPDASVSEAGSVRPCDLDHRGCLLAEDVISRTASAIQHQLSRLGFTPAFTAETSISRMAVEQIVLPSGRCRAGAFLRVRSRLGGLGEKSLWAAHWLETIDGTAVATVYRHIVTVDLKLRRAVPLPEFLRSHVL